VTQDVPNEEELARQARESQHETEELREEAHRELGEDEPEQDDDADE
jgi:hypothetical protein